MPQCQWWNYSSTNLFPGIVDMRKIWFWFVCLFKHLFASSDKKSSESGKIVWVQAKFHPSVSMRPPLVQMLVTTVAADLWQLKMRPQFSSHNSLSLSDQTPMRTQCNYATQHHTRRLDARMNIVTFFAFPRFSQHLCTAIISSSFFFKWILQELSLLSSVPLPHIQFTLLACQRLLITCDCLL